MLPARTVSRVNKTSAVYSKNILKKPHHAFAKSAQEKQMSLIKCLKKYPANTGVFFSERENDEQF